MVLRNKRMSDARNDYRWQSDPELARLDAAPPLDCKFDEFLSEYAGELMYPPSNRRSFAIETTQGKHIGNCVYYNVNEDGGEAELGIMIGDRHYWNKGYGSAAVRALLTHVFRHTSLTRVHLKTLVDNARAQKCFKKCGFQPCGELERDSYRFLLMDQTRDQWLRRHQQPEQQAAGMSQD